jgi:hypothetical protein
MYSAPGTTAIDECEEAKTTIPSQSSFSVFWKTKQEIKVKCDTCSYEKEQGSLSTEVNPEFLNPGSYYNQLRAFQRFHCLYYHLGLTELEFSRQGLWHTV